MIRVGIGKPTLKFVEGHNDMSAYFPSHWEVNDNYFYMDLNDYMEKRAFDKFNMNPDFTQEQIGEMTKRVMTGGKIRPEECLMNPAMTWARDMQNHIQKSGGFLIWQFNAVHPNMKDWVRQAICIGENKLRLWSWYDVNVKLPYLRKLASVLNYLNRSRAQKEIDEWEEFLNDMHKEKKNGNS